MPTISIKLSDPQFLQKMELHKDHHSEWETPTGCTFQGAATFELLPTMQGRYRWLNISFAEMHREYKANPELKLKLCITGGSCRSYSRAKIKNLRVRIWTP